MNTMYYISHSDMQFIQDTVKETMSSGEVPSELEEVVEILDDLAPVEEVTDALEEVA